MKLTVAYEKRVCFTHRVCSNKQPSLAGDCGTLPAAAHTDSLAGDLFQTIPQ